MADDAQQAADLLDDIELPEFAHRRLHRGLLGLMGDEHEAGLFPQALLLGGTDAHVVTGEHSGHLMQDPGPIEHVEAEEVFGARLVDGEHGALGQRADTAVSSGAQVHRGVDHVAEHRARGRQTAGMLRLAGCANCVVDNTEDFVSLAIATATERRTGRYVGLINPDTGKVAPSQGECFDNLSSFLRSSFG